VLVLDCSGNFIDRDISENAFDGAEGAAQDRFYDAYGSKICCLVVILSCEGEPVGFCSYFHWITRSLDGDWFTLNYKIDYVYIMKEFRGMGFSNKIYPVVVDGIYQGCNKARVEEVFDASEYIDFGGIVFGEKIRRGLMGLGSWN